MTAEATTEAGPAGDSELERSITGRVHSFYVLGDALGSGIHVLIGAVAAVVGGASWIAFILVLAVVDDIGITESVVITMVMTVVGLLLFAAEKACGSRTRPPGAPPSIADPTGGA